MKKATKAAVVLTPEEMAIQRAEYIAQTRAKIKELGEDLDKAEAEQIEYMKANGTTSYGGFKLVETSGRVKWDGLTGKALTVAKERLLGLVDPIYIKNGLDESKLFAAYESDMAVVGAFSTVGIKLVKGENSFSLKAE